MRAGVVVRQAILALSVVLAVQTTVATEPAQRTLTLEDRVRAQAAIERVYYSHQIGATTSFDEAMPRALLESRVRKYVEQTAALTHYWKTAVTDEMLQRELERMAHGTRMPERLLELYAAMGNDSFLIKECLARATLVDRLTRNFYAFDSSIHADARRRAEQIHTQLSSGELDPSADHPNRNVSELTASAEGTGAVPTELPVQPRLTPDELQARRAELPSRVGELSAVKESGDAFAFNVIVSETTTNVRVANYVVPKITWDAWWATASLTLRGESIAVAAIDRGVLPVP